MRVHALIAAAALALAAPSASQAADMSLDYAWSPNCGGLEPVDVYVPPQTAYIVACKVPLPEPVVVYRKAKHGHHDHFAKAHGHGHKSHGHGHSAGGELVAEVDWRYGNPATHEGALVYLQQWSADRPPVHFLVVPK